MTVRKENLNYERIFDETNIPGYNNKVPWYLITIKKTINL